MPAVLQEVRKEALKIAEKYGGRERDTYLEAARQLRLPYYDWTSEAAANEARHLNLVK